MIIYGSLEMKSVRKRFASCRAFRVNLLLLQSLLKHYVKL